MKRDLYPSIIKILLASPLGGRFLKGIERAEFSRSPILVTGLPRSGTSMVAGCLHLAGAWTGRTVAAGRYNRKGFFENVELRDGLNKGILKSVGADTSGVDPLPSLDSISLCENLREEALACIVRQGYFGKTPWLFKDAKLSLTWPAFNHAFPNAKWVIVVRDRDKVVDSCLNTPFMARHSTDREFWNNWYGEYEQRLGKLANTAKYTVHIHSDDIVNKTQNDLRNLIEWLGLHWDCKKISKFIEPSFWESNRSLA